ncbi:MAG TPA: molybdate ABC transporter substrate-binding protein [Acidobacteriaceae bacterium]|nr:molybdate ABC transporter substrate-binding protein [Acidobacteriaceae bacterium]
MGHQAIAKAQNETPPLRIAAAADLQPVLPTLAAEYTRQFRTAILPSFGSSATLTQQIQNGAPVDLFLSADCALPQLLADAHLTSAPPTPYATGVLVLWARKDSPAQPLTLGSLTSPKVTRIAVANDLHAPYGQAATAELRALHLQESLTPKLVTGENIMQTAQFAYAGNAQAAFISLTIASSPHFRETGTFIPLPRRYPPIRQCGVVLTHATNPASAQNFLRWLTSPAVQTKLPQFGLDPAH